MNWTRDQLTLTFHLYCQLPFGQLDQRHPEVIQLASSIGRTPSAVAMKLVNFASLDPAIRSSGRKGLDGASKLDRVVWDEFHQDWDRLALLASKLRQERGLSTSIDADASTAPFDDYTGETRPVLIQQRIRQGFFRRAVLSSYRSRCCMSGLSNPDLLIASHIVPWSQSKATRLNPSNGLCLSALHDKAFDKGLITITDDYRILVSQRLKASADDLIARTLTPLDGKSISLPERFSPAKDFVRHHRMEIFVDR